MLILVYVISTAACYPENLLLLLGSVPVEIDKNLHNIGIFVQCGESGIIHPFLKAVPSMMDYKYEDTSTFPLQNVYMPPEQIQKIDLLRNDLLQKNFRSLITVQDLQELEKISQIHPTIQPPALFFQLLKDMLEKFKKNKNYIKKQEAKIAMQEIFTLLDDFINKNYDEWKKEVEVLPYAIFSDKSDQVNIYSSGSISIKTAGNAEFSLLPEICLDHQKKVIKNRVLQDVRLAKSKADTRLSSKGLHVLASNSIRPMPDHIVSHSFIHTDPFNSRSHKSVFAKTGALKAEKFDEISDPAFGSKTHLEVYPVMEVNDFMDTIKKDLDEYNRFFMKLNALRHYRSQKLFNLNEIDIDIIQLIYEPIIALIPSSSTLKKSIKEFAQVKNYGDGIDILKKFAASKNLKKLSASQEKTIHEAILTALNLLEAEKESSNKLAEIHQLAMQKTKDLPPMPVFPRVDFAFFSKPTSTKSLPVSSSHLLGEATTSGTTNFSDGLPTHETLILTRLLTHFSPFTLPWNRVYSLNSMEEKQLEQHLKEVSALEKELYSMIYTPYGTCTDKEDYHDLHILIKHTKDDIETMLAKKQKTQGTFETVKDNMERIQCWLQKSHIYAKK